MPSDPRDAPSSGRFEGREHILPVRIYYEDTDFTGVVYHANYLRFFERGRSDALRAAGVSHSDLLEGERPSAFTIVHMEIDFRRPARIDDALEVRTLYERIRGPRLFIRQRILRGAELLCEAQVEAACIDLSGRPTRPSPRLVAQLTPILGDAG
ncbi:tol-pal system-associated acyl-CoA thioesterase [Phenylobacterium sp.]|jgi:acyl-CoA thioester hydrolase|uniref:tol-pal system-associated acyl-CoA thioesterase n=1 Tax=Phenylobacterium sp. TaxID=1871053 RepID=UPI0025F7826C|nr:tol-pal system-associated acyl-CoA thioesterase [Phenylobacterium sp.]MCA3720391.1 tol-pal system-associated acyl-CoA thioesterase [Phenylobacterium sp.]